MSSESEKKKKKNVTALTCLHESIFSSGIIKVSKMLSYIISNPITIQQGKSYSLQIRVLFKNFQQEKACIVCTSKHRRQTQREMLASN